MLDWMLLYVCRLVRMLICAEGCFVIPRRVGAVARPVPGSEVGGPVGAPRAAQGPSEPPPESPQRHVLASK